MSTTNPTAETTDRPTAFELGLDALVRRYAALYPTYTVGFETLTRYVRLYKSSGSIRSTIVFVDGLNGDVRRADSWKRAGYVIGSIYPLSAEVSL